VAEIGNVVLDIKDQLTLWEKYIENLFNDQREEITSGKLLVLTICEEEAECQEVKVIHRRVYKKLEENIDDTQFGFRNRCCTREALFAYNVLMQRCLDVNQKVYTCFIERSIY